MDRRKEIKDHVQNLLKQADELLNELKKSGRIDGTQELFMSSYFLNNYNIWYTKSLRIVQVFAPLRYEDFKLLYRNDKRKMLNADTYTISDALRFTEDNLGSYEPKIAWMCLSQQKAILEACFENIDSNITDIITLLQADVFDSEIESAKHLKKSGYLRAAGVICGVLIEKHLSAVCKSHNVVVEKKEATIATLNDKLKDVAYDTIEWRRMSRLADLRNLCSHNKHREPTGEEVEELINGTDRVLKTIF